MTHILHIDSSIFGKNGNSAQLGAKLVGRLAERLEGASVTHRDLVGTEIPHFTAETIAQIGKGEAALADELIDELQKADVLVLGVPMYNFGVPSQLKSWFDHIARAGTTFKYTETGPVGLLTGKKAYIVTARGGLHKGQATDVESDFLKIMLGFIGITDVEIIYAEGMNLGEHKEKSFAKAETDVLDAAKKYTR